MRRAGSGGAAGCAGPARGAGPWARKAARSDAGESRDASGAPGGAGRRRDPDRKGARMGTNSVWTECIFNILPPYPGTIGFTRTKVGRRPWHRGEWPTGRGGGPKASRREPVADRLRRPLSSRTSSRLHAGRRTPVFRQPDAGIKVARSRPWPRHSGALPSRLCAGARCEYAASPRSPSPRSPSLALTASAPRASPRLTWSAGTSVACAAASGGGCRGGGPLRRCCRRSRRGRG
jgi:hypothetical protein